MNSLLEPGESARHPVRVAVLAAALAVTACFGAAMTFTGDAAQASQVEASR